MKVEQIYTGCLAQGAYYIESDGEAAVIDPLREVGDYVERAQKNRAKIKYIFETHFHADFVSGHLSLSQKTGAPIIFGPTANPSFEAIIAKDGQEFLIGKVKIKALHTPGHTMESTSYLLIDEEGNNHALFSGDTLFLGDVGRPDLAQKASNLTQEDLAGILYDSLRSKIMTLEDEVLIYPAHGAGSACGKNMMKETVDTLGNQRLVNYALRADMTKDEFIKEVTDGLLAPPAYFPMNVRMNKEGYQDVDVIIKSGHRAFNPNDFELIANQSEAIILDVRHQNEFVKSHIPNSIFIGLDGDFAPWVGAMIKDVEQAILLVGDESRIDEAITRLSRVGFDNTIGYLEGGIKAWIKAGKEIDTMKSISPAEFETIFNSDMETIVFDVRRLSEYNANHIVNAMCTPLASINNHLAELPREDDFYLHCAGGYRSVIAGSILKSRGYHNLINIEGGFDVIKNTKVLTTDYVCPTKLN